MSEAIGDKVRRLRLAAGMTREQLAAKVGISGPFLWRIERGDRGMSDRTLIAVAEALNVDAGELGRRAA